MSVPLVAARDPAQFGGKAAQLAVALGAGLPVPPGFALAWRTVDALVGGDDDVAADLARAFADLDGAVAVRSSAVGEDAATASFAGQHATILNVCTNDAVHAAVVEVWRSARNEGALAYRKKLGVEAEPQIAVVVQQLVAAEVAGVLFSVNPMSGADERVIEASWGIGEAVVAGLVTPDRFRVARGGGVLEVVAGVKDIAVAPLRSGGTNEVRVDEARARALCLSTRQLVALDALATRCESVFVGAQDLEFAFLGERLFLLQRRPVTRARKIP